ncbi:tRNA threonylcarbamoyladenosine biosynthesis protein TsaE [hydrothermal vent metagenome]|uniref:tRNA threonylcarbamoyladenosine biosynthesis protein TsaE n=1 Tax=hydrothermal vent metagenome TaxID=652676 RepID=A0A3B0R542_9ZZZZ
MIKIQSNLRQIQLSSPEEMQQFGVKLARLLGPADTVFLIGDLGTGKTTLAKGIIGALSGNSDEVTSPTYNLVHVWPYGDLQIWHVDLYRLDAPKQVAELGLQDAFGQHLCLIEWPDRLGEMAPAQRLDILFTKTATGRSITLRPIGRNWQERLDGF